MGPTERCQVDKCLATANHPRHVHPCSDLRQIGEPCYCGANAWVIHFGGGIPAVIRCPPCGAAFNISKRLREIGTPRAIWREV